MAEVADPNNSQNKSTGDSSGKSNLQKTKDQEAVNLYFHYLKNELEEERKLYLLRQQQRSQRYLVTLSVQLVENSDIYDIEHRITAGTSIHLLYRI